MPLWQYALRRLLLLVPVLFGISIVTFAITHLIPRNPVYALVGTFADQSLVDATIARFGLDQPLPVQYQRYMLNLLRGDLGTSIKSGRPVWDEIVHRLPATLELTTMAMVCALVLAVLLGTYAALRRGRAGDVGVRVFALIGNSLPEFWIGLVLLFLLYFQLGWAPAPMGRIASGLAPPQTVTHFYLVDAVLTGNWSAFRAAVSQAFLPVLTLALVIAAPLMRMVRANLIEALNSPYIRCARAHGLRHWRILWQYGLRNALLPVVTLTAIVYGYLLGGAVLIEKVFSWPGVGQWAADAVLSQDYPAVQAFALVSAAFYMLVYLVADLVLALVDPRIRY